MVLSTKGGHPAEPGLPRLDRESLRRDLAESLAHLNTDHVELYFLHRDDPRRPVGEILESLNEWVESGAVRALGASNWRASRIEEANRYAASHGLQGFTVSQIQWSLARTSPDKLGDPTLVCMTPAEYAWYREQRFPVMAYTSQAGGYFSKTLSGAPLSPGDQARYGCEENSRRMERVKTICARRGVTPAAVCLAAITENPLPGCAIVGFSSLARLRDTLSDASLELSPEEVAWLWDGSADNRPVP